MRDSFIFYRSFFEAIDNLPQENQTNIYKAIAEFSLNNKEIELNGVEKTVFILIKPQLEANNKKYINGTKEKKQKISKTEAKNKQNRSKTQGNVNVNDNVNDNVNKNENKEIINLVLHNWNIRFFEMHNLSKIKNIDKTRESNLFQRLEECDKQDLKNAVKIFFNAWNEKIRKNDFYKGINSKNWKMDFDFAITKSKFTPVLEEYLQNKEVSNDY